MTRTLSAVIGAAAALLLLAACGGSSTSPTSSGSDIFSPSSYPPGPLVLTVSPIDQAAIRWITPLGNLNPPAHTTPTDHIYFYFANPDAGEQPAAKRTAFLAPGSGTVTTVLGGVVGAESKVWVRQTSTFTYYLDHLILTAPLTSGATITAGQVLGTTGLAYGVDLGVMNDSMSLGFANPSRYPPDTTLADAPLKYFQEPVRSQLYARVQRQGSDLDGKICYDVAGRLAGNWFQANGSQMAFVYDTWNPSKVLISMNSGTLIGVYSTAAGDPAPNDVSPPSGQVLYTLIKTSSGPNGANNNAISAYLLVQMTDATHLRIEGFLPGASTADFTAAAREFIR